MAELRQGDAAPDFQLLDQNGKAVTLSSFRGGKVLLYFYPKADTPGCTTQSCSVRDALPDFSKLQVDALGISPDMPDKQKTFDDKYVLGFSLLSDPDHAVAEAYAVWGEKKMYGKTSMGIVRAAFLVDERGKVARAWYKVSPKDTVPNALDALSS